MEKSLKIANVVRRFTFDEWGGTETVVWNSAIELARHGHHPAILCTSALAKPGPENVSGIDIMRFPYTYARLPLSGQNAARLDKKGGNPFSPALGHAIRDFKPDLIHCHTMGRLGGMCRRISRRLKVPYIVSLHGGCFDVPPQEIAEMVKPMQGSFNWGKFIDLLIDRENFLAAADGIICVGYSEYLAVSEKYPEKAVEYMPNGVDPERFKRQVDFDFRRHYRIDPDAEMLLCVSRIDYQKNQLMLVELASRLNASGENIHVVLIGPVTVDSYYDQIKALIAEKQLRDKVTIIPGLHYDSDELIAAYQTADIFVLPSIHEPFGIVALEAWSANVPLLAANTGGLARLVEDGKTAMVFEPDSLDSLLAARSRLNASQNIAKTLVANAASLVEGEYTWDKITSRLENFYGRVIEEFNCDSHPCLTQV